MAGPTRRDLFTAFLAPSTPARRPGPVLVSLFLRGGADGLSLVVPHGDPDYARARPLLGLSPPGQGAGSCLDLDGFFGLHPGLAPLLPAWEAGRLAVVHAVGSDDATRSHFEAQDRMEWGTGDGRAAAGGWLGRYLRARGASTSLAAVALGSQLPECLRGAPAAAAMERLADLQLRGPEEHAEAVMQALGALYQPESMLGRAGRDTLALLRRTEALRAPAPTGAYPAGDFGDGLRDLARLIRADLGLEAACLDLGGWDTHFFQGTTRGVLAGRVEELASGLAAFQEDLGPDRHRVVVVVMTEFGRRVTENASLGTDHGRASVMFVLGEGLRGGRVYGRWPGLAAPQLEGPGDLRVTSDFRQVLAEVCAHHGRVAVGAVFPELRGSSLGLAA